MASQVDKVNPNYSHSSAWIPCHQSGSFTGSGLWNSWPLLFLPDRMHSLTLLENGFSTSKTLERSLRGSEPAPGLGSVWVDQMDTQGRGRDTGWKESSLPAGGWGGEAGILGSYPGKVPSELGLEGQQEVEFVAKSGQDSWGILTGTLTPPPLWLWRVVEPTVAAKKGLQEGGTTRVPG